MEVFRIQYRMSLNCKAISSPVLPFNVLVLPSLCHFTCTLLPIIVNCITFIPFLPIILSTNLKNVLLKRRHLFCEVWVCVRVGFVMCGCFINLCTCFYCVLYCLYCVFVLFRLCILFVLLCVSVLVICVPVFTVFCIVCSVFLYCFVYVYYLFCYVWVFSNMCTCIYCVLYCLYCVFVLFLLCVLFVLSVLV